MKHLQQPEGRTRFSTTVRHYHRGHARPKRSWDDWVEGVSAKPPVSKGRLKIIGIALSLLALSGIIAGLIIEMR